MHKVGSVQPASQNLRPFRPGRMAPISGIYRVVHKIPHRSAHEVMAIRGEHFPTCRVCQGRVEFRVIRAVSHMVHDWDFAGPLVK